MYCIPLVIVASLSEPHTSESNGGFFIGVSVSEPYTSESNFADFSYMCISVVRRSVNVGSYSFKTIARRVNIEENLCIQSSYKCYIKCKVETYFTVSLTSELSLLVSNITSIEELSTHRRSKKIGGASYRTQ